MKMSGQTNKRLCGLVSESGRPLSAGMRLTSAEAAGKDLGWITSAIRSPALGQEIGLGYVKRGFCSIGTELAVVDAAIRVKIVTLPFVGKH